MDLKRIQNKVIASVASYFALDTVTKQLANVPNLDVNKQAMVISLLGLFLPDLFPKKAKGAPDMQTEIITDIADNMLFVGVSMLVPTLQQKTALPAPAPAPATNGYSLGENPFSTNSLINGYALGENPFSTNSLINGFNQGMPSYENYVNCPSEINCPSETVDSAYYMADIQGNPIAPAPIETTVGTMEKVSDFEKYCN